MIFGVNPLAKPRDQSALTLLDALLAALSDTEATRCGDSARLVASRRASLLPKCVDLIFPRCVRCE